MQLHAPNPRLTTPAWAHRQQLASQASTSARQHLPPAASRPITACAAAHAPLQAASRQAAQLSASNLTGLPLQAATAPSRPTGAAYDVVLSSGFLAFAYHAGFLQAAEQAGLPIGAVMGTSAGALAGSLYCAGLTPQEVAAELSRAAPIELLRPCWQPCRGGVISLQAVVARLTELLPPTFEQLPRPFACGVVDRNGNHHIISSGPLAPAVAASAAIPLVFAAVDIPGDERGPFKDGGLVDRVGLVGFRRHRRHLAATQPDSRLAWPRAVGSAGTSGTANGTSSSTAGASTSGSGSGAGGEAPPPALVHLIARSSQFSGDDDVSKSGEKRVTVVRSPRSGVNFFSLGDFEAQLDAAYARALPAMRSVRQREAGAREQRVV